MSKQPARDGQLSKQDKFRLSRQVQEDLSDDGSGTPKIKVTPHGKRGPGNAGKRDQPRKKKTKKNNKYEISKLHQGALGVKEAVAGMTNNPRELKRMIEQLMEQNREAEQERDMNDYLRRPGARRWNKVRNIGRSDPQAQQTISYFVKGLYSQQKFLDENWHVVSKKKYSICQLLKHMMITRCHMQSPPDGLSWPEYFTSRLCAPLHCKFGQTMNQKLQKMREGVKGKFATLSSVRRHEFVIAPHLTWH